MNSISAMQEMSHVIAQKRAELQQIDDFDDFLAWAETADLSSMENFELGEELQEWDSGA